MRIMVTGAGGMLGTEVVRAVARSPHKLDARTREELDIANEDFVPMALEDDDYDAVINCAGLTPQRPGVTALQMIESNALGPQLLAQECELRKIRLVHVSTDCVFAGDLARGSGYVEGQTRDPIDLYGWTKAAGEPDNDVTLNVRCSFVWPTGGLVKWVTEQTETFPGWARAIWSGLTARAYARILVELAERDIVGPLHVPGEKISKFRLVIDAATMLGLCDRGIDVEPVDKPSINRQLASSRWADEVGIEVPDWHTMLVEMGEFYNG